MTRRNWRWRLRACRASPLERLRSPGRTRAAPRQLVRGLRNGRLNPTWVRRFVDDEGGGDGVVAQRRNEGGDLPLTVRHFADQTLAATTATCRPHPPAV